MGIEYEVQAGTSYEFGLTPPRVCDETATTNECFHVIHNGERVGSIYASSALDLAQEKMKEEA